MKKKKSKGSPVSAVFSALGTVLLILVILACIPLTVPRMFGYQIFTVISGSMEPEIPVGSLVYVQQVVPKEIEKEDVVAFYGGSQSNAIITHRVVENNSVTGELITKGDANEVEDMNPVMYSNLIGQVKYVIPYAGNLAQLFTSTYGKLIGGGVIFIAILLHVIAYRLGKRN